jgi:hypothetical protein
MYFYSHFKPQVFTIQPMKRQILPILLLLPGLFLGCHNVKKEVVTASDPRLVWQGRTWQESTGHMYLNGSASSLQFKFYGDACRIWLQNRSPDDGYNYISLVIDGVRQPRMAIRSDTLTPMDIIAPVKGLSHELSLYKETEAVNGSIIISAIEADSFGTLPQVNKKRIEFIGNSITVGMSSDESLVACDGGTWYDQHNAYDAFGPRVARALDMEYMVSGFSGIGVYRNTRSDSPVMKDIYSSAFLLPDAGSPRWDFSSFTPDIISICLGTNDFSAGDGPSPRSPFEALKFIPAYVSFIKMLHGHHPKAQIIITNTPMLSSSDNIVLLDCLAKIKTSAESTIVGIKPVAIFSFSKMYNSGCYGHPSVEEHALMAEELTTFLRDHSSTD